MRIKIASGRPCSRKSRNRRFNHKMNTTLEHLGRIYMQIGMASGKPMNKFIRDTKRAVKE